MKLTPALESELLTQFAPLGTTEERIQFSNYSVLYDRDTKEVSCSYGVISPGKTLASIYRNGKKRGTRGLTCFTSFPSVHSPSGNFLDGTTFQMGHGWPARYTLYDETGVSLTNSNYTVNILPETRALNCGPMLALETTIFKRAMEGNVFIVYTGGVYSSPLQMVNGVPVPPYVYKIVAKPHNSQVCCYLMPNVEFLSDDITRYQRSFSEMRRLLNISIPALNKFYDTPDLLAESKDLFPSFPVGDLQTEQLDADNWVVLFNFAGHVWDDQNQKNYHFIIPRGFITDYASVPYGFRWYVPRKGTNVDVPAVWHDYMYATEYPTWFDMPFRHEENKYKARLLCDQIFRNGLKEKQIGHIKRNIIYDAVRLGGGFVWDKHTIESIEWNRNLLINIDIKELYNGENIA